MIKIFYLSCHNLLKKRYGVNRIIPRKEVNRAIGQHFLVPKNLKNVAIKELEDMELIKQIDRDNIKILNCELDLKEDAHRFLQKLNI